jgi:hypothetical protein
MRPFLAPLALVCVAAASGFATWAAFRPADGPARPAAAPQVAPGAARVVQSYLQALQSGHWATACRLFTLPSVCSSTDAPRVARFTVERPELTVDGFDVRATIDGQDALFQLQGRRGHYRIVEVVTDPTPPGVAATGLAF